MISRRKWGARPHRGRSFTTPHTMVIHHSAGFGNSIDTDAEQRATMAQFQHHHQNINGWSDIGYNYVLFQPQGRLKFSRVYEGRGFGVLPAAQGGANSGTVAICVVGNFQSERVKRRAIKRLNRIAKAWRKRGVSKLRGHRDFGGTSCPGDHLYAKLPEIRKASGLR